LKSTGHAFCSGEIEEESKEKGSGEMEEGEVERETEMRKGNCYGGIFTLCMGKEKRTLIRKSID
jgi:hypothetical protein